ncbi:MAG TPA: class I SAM-dependent methyltransferase [Candidatus Saccharimonadales bacterium]|jgi:hypothetical protein|nr:class I SAM-dependent methyltransferase [Candidatus Saccharimonadales bacterium]
MAFKYEEAVPWGRSFNEYQRMFDLSKEDLDRKILGCADGPASFNAAMFRNGHRVVSCDPLYQFSRDQIKSRIDAVYDQVIGQTKLNKEKFNWNLIASPDELGRIRLEAMADFLGDYEQGKLDSRYIAAELPDLPFESQSFDMALCSHFLFLYSESLSFDFHRRAFDELCRVAREVRVFPLLTYNAEPCSFVGPIVDHLKMAGHKVSVERVPYEFQRNGNMAMRIIPTPRIGEPSR